MMNFSADNEHLRIETDRLILFPLNYRQLRKFLNNNLSLEKELGLALIPRLISEKLEDILEEEILVKVSQNQNLFHFHTLWLIIQKVDLTIVGDINSKFLSVHSGELEIGYETIDEFQNNGYMTEAVHGFIHWLAKYPQVTTVLARTDSSNIPSISVLKKNNFSPYHLAGNIIRWQKIIRNNSSYSG